MAIRIENKSLVMVEKQGDLYDIVIYECGKRENRMLSGQELNQLYEEIEKILAKDI